MPRKIKDIAEDIRKTWSTIPRPAVPWLNLMLEIDDTNDEVQGHTGDAVVLLFLAYSALAEEQLRQELLDLPAIKKLAKETV